MKTTSLVAAASVNLLVVAMAAGCGGFHLPGEDAGVEPVDSAPPPPSGECKVDSDCRTVSDYCEGCTCLSLPNKVPVPPCKGNIVQCFVDPCARSTAVCAQGKCALQDKTPVDPACQPIREGGPTSCKDPALWEKYAFDKCASLGLTLQGPPTLSEPCDHGNFRVSSYQCCKQVPPVDPGCKPMREGGSTSCKDAATWKKYATIACEGIGLPYLRNLSLTESCFGPDWYRWSSYECCALPSQR